MTENSPIERAALRLREAGAASETCAPIRDLIAADDLAAAYAVQAANHRHWIATGRRPIGAKVALSAKAIQEQMGVTAPTHGRLFADMVWAEGQEVPFSRLVQPKLETEIAVVLERDLTAVKNTIAEVLAAIAYAVPAFEVVGCRVEGWDVKIADFVADNSAASHIVLGTTPKKVGSFDPFRARMATRLDGAVVSSGVGAAVAGNPFAALAWLADALALDGRPLRAGDVIMTGSLGPMAPIAPGNRFEAEIEGLGRIETAFSSL